MYFASDYFICLILTSVYFLSSSTLGSAALPSNMKYFGSAHADEDADEEEEEEEEEENERKKPSVSNITASCQVTSRRSKAPGKVLANGDGTIAFFSYTIYVQLALLVVFLLRSKTARAHGTLLQVHKKREQTFVLRVTALGG